MGADTDAIRLGEANHARHRVGIAGMETTGDVGRRDDLHQRLVIAEPVRAKPLAHVRIHVDLHRVPPFPDCRLYRPAMVFRARPTICEVLRTSST